MAASTTSNRKSKIFNPRAWGLSRQAIEGLGDRLYEHWERYEECFQTMTRDSSPYALDFLSGLLRMEKERSFTKIAQTAGQSPQNIQHFMSNSPWSSQEVLEQIREEICQTPALTTGSALILDESADEKASEKTAGAARQRNGRLGKVEMSQVGTFLAYAKDGLWTWVDGELFLPEHWFERQKAKERRRLGVPPDKRFATKIELGWRMIERVTEEGLPYDWVCFDTLYGRSHWLRRKVAGLKRTYMADVPADEQVYLNEPVVGVPERKAGRSRPPTRRCVLSEERPVEVRTLATAPETQWTRIRARVAERGYIEDEFSARLVWTTHQGEEPVQEWLVMRRERDGRVYQALSNASAETSLEVLARGKLQRYFVEASIREAKSEAGWDELRAQKYLAWEHQLALTCLATWFITQTKLEWIEKYPRDPEVAKELGLDQLPALSTANIRELLRAVMPLPQLTREAATELVVEQLVNRARARKSRLKSSGYDHSFP